MCIQSQSCLAPVDPNQPATGRLFVARATALLLPAVVAILLAACDGGPPVNFVVVGDSLSAGHQNGCTVQYYEDPHDGMVYQSQDWGYAYQIASSANWDLRPPYLSWPGARPCMAIGEDYNLLTVDRVVPFPDYIDASTWGTRVNPMVVTNNLSAPGTRVLDVGLAPPDPPPGEYHWKYGLDYLAMWTLFADKPNKTPDVSLIDQAVSRINATTDDRDLVILWLGSNDALWSAIYGVSTDMTDAVTFQTDYENVINTLDSALRGPNARLVVANLPDLTVAPHFMPAAFAVSQFGLTLDMVILPPDVTVGQMLNITASDRVTLQGLATMGGLIQCAVTTVTDCGDMGDNDFLSSTEVTEIQSRISDYNTTIANAASAHGALLVDIAGLLNDAKQYGYPVGNETLTTDYFGGIFSLDGVHPNNTGYAAVANEFIRAMNTAYGWHIKLVDEVVVRAAEPPHNRGLGGPF